MKNNWRTALDQQRKLKARGAELLWDRVKLLVQCYDDEDFRAWVFDQGSNELDYLDEELSDVAASFLTLAAVLKQYPNKEDWVRHNIRELIALVLDAERDKRKAEADPRISWKERALAAEREIERLKAEVAGLKKSLEIVAGARCG